MSTSCQAQNLTSCHHIGLSFSPVSVLKGGKEVFLVIFKCLAPLIETSKAVPLPRPPWDFPGVEGSWAQPGVPSQWGFSLGCPPPSSRSAQLPLVLSLSLMVRGQQARVGAGPSSSWNTEHSPPHLEGRAPHIWKSSIRWQGGGKFFTFLPDVWQEY